MATDVWKGIEVILQFIIDANKSLFFVKYFYYIYMLLTPILILSNIYYLLSSIYVKLVYFQYKVPKYHHRLGALDDWKGPTDRQTIRMLKGTCLYHLKDCAILKA